MKKLITILISILIILMFLIIGSIIYLKKGIDMDKENSESIGDPGVTIDYATEELTTVTSNSDFFTVYNCVQNYISKLNASYYDDNDEELFGTDIYNLLSNEYIEKNNITLENIKRNITFKSEQIIFIPVQMKYIDLGTINRYVVYGVCQNIQNEYIDDMYILVDLDFNNKTYSITPLENKKYSNIEDIEVNKEIEAIDSNNYNTFREQTITYKYLCNQYLIIFKRLMLVKPEIAYNYIDEEYKLNRFATLNDYLNYISKNRDEIEKISLDSYGYNIFPGYTEYICKDNYGNVYTFNEKYVMNFTVILDTYTIKSNEEKKEYANYSIDKKIANCAYRWVLMLNNRDYTSAYNCLNETFRKNNFKNIEAFENYMRKNYPLHYEIEYGECKQYGVNYSQEIILKDITGKSEETKTIILIIHLREGTDFEISFNIE